LGGDDDDLRHWTGEVVSIGTVKQLQSLQHAADFAVKFSATFNGRHKGSVHDTLSFQVSKAWEQVAMKDWEFEDCETVRLRFNSQKNATKRIVIALHRLRSKDALYKEYKDNHLHPFELETILAIPERKETPSRQPFAREQGHSEKYPVAEESQEERRPWQRTVKIQQELLQGIGFPSLVELGVEPSSPLSGSGLDMATSRLKFNINHGLRPRLPFANFLAVRDEFGEKFRDIVLNMFEPGFLQQIKPFVEKVPLGFLLLTGPAGHGKTEAMSAFVVILLNSPDHDRAVVYGPSNASRDYDCDRIFSLNREITAHINCTLPPSRRRHFALIIRGHTMHSELDEVIRIFQGGKPTTAGESLSKRASTYRFQHSLAEWLLKVLRFGDYSLDGRDSDKLADVAYYVEVCEE
jgi:hypothetical protein